jgi:hypothetical protein
VQPAALALLDAYIQYFPALSKFSTEPIPDRQHWDISEPTSLSKIWKLIDEGEASMNLVKSSQLLRLAKMLADYPGMLRIFQGGSQEPRLHFLQHRVDEFERIGRRMLTPQVLGRTFVVKAWFSEHRFPLVPYDRYLKVFLKVLHKFPLQVAGGVETTCQSCRLTLASCDLT